MIAYTLLTTHRNKDIVSVAMTALVIYVLCYNLLPKDYSYLAVAAMAVSDMYLTKGFKFSKERPARGEVDLDRGRTDGRRVRFAETVDVRTYTPAMGLAPAPTPAPVYGGPDPVMAHSPEYRLWQQQQQQIAQQQYMQRQYQQQYLQQLEQQQNQRQQNEHRDAPQPDDTVSTSSSEITFSSEEY